MLLQRVSNKMLRRYIYVKRSYRFLFRLIDVIGGVIVSLIKFALPLRNGLEIKKIVVIELAHIGDVLAVTPALRLLRKKFPCAHIAMVISPWTREVISGNPDIDEIIIYRASWFDRIDKRRFYIKETINFIQTLRKGKFDLGIDMRGDFRSIFLLWLGRVKYRIGYGFAGGGFLLSKVVPFNVEMRQDRHQIDHNLNLIKAIPFGNKLKKLQCRDKRLTIYFSDNEINYIDRYFKESLVTGSDLLIAIHLGSGISSKCWPIERFASLIDEIGKRYEAKIVLVGGREEVDLGKKIASTRPLVRSRNDIKGISCAIKLVNAIGATSIKQTAALLKRCSLFIGGDSGLMHIASAVGTPIVAIWGGHNKPSLWRPLRDTDIVIHKHVDCSPCGLSNCRDLKCLKQIIVDDVLKGAITQIERIKGV